MRTPKSHAFHAIGILAFLMPHFGCGSPETAESPTNEAASDDSGPVVEQDTSDGTVRVIQGGNLGSEVNLLDEPEAIEISAPGQDGADADGAGESAEGLTSATASGLGSGDLTLSLIATIEAPLIGGVRVQATSVDLTGTTAVVSYNVAGPDYGGAIDILNLKNPAEPQLIARLEYPGIDVNGAMIRKNRIIATLATDTLTDEATSFIESIPIRSQNVVLDERATAPLDGYAATGVTRSGSRLYVTDGNNGGLYRFHPVTLAREAYVGIPDARWVHHLGSEIYVLEGTEGSVRHLKYKSGDFEEQGTIDVMGVAATEARASVHAYKNYLYVAANEGGMRVYNRRTGVQVAHLENPTPTDNDFDAADSVCNAVGASGKLIFISFGGAGVYVARNQKNLYQCEQDTDVSPEVVGRLVLGDQNSVNDVKYRSRTLIVASGLGGVKIIRVQP